MQIKDEKQLGPESVPVETYGSSLIYASTLCRVAVRFPGFIRVFLALFFLMPIPVHQNSVQRR
jgi:hypothetical protein